MEENYRLEKEYTVSPDIFDKAYKSYQKKFVYLKSYIFMGIFLLLAADFIWAAAKNPGNTLVYLLIVVCIALAFREWHNPRFIRRRLYETVRDMGKVVYKIGVGDGFIDISTVDDGTSGDDDEDEDSGGNAEETSAEKAEDTEENDDISPEAEELMPEKSRLNTKENYSLLEYDEYFLLMQGKEVFYILPKAGFSEDELEIIRKTSAQGTE